MVKLVITRYHEMTTKVYWMEALMHVTVYVCICEYVSNQICVYVFITIKTFY